MNKTSDPNVCFACYYYFESATKICPHCGCSYLQQSQQKLIDAIASGVNTSPSLSDLLDRSLTSVNRSLAILEGHGAISRNGVIGQGRAIVWGVVK